MVFKKKTKMPVMDKTCKYQWRVFKTDSSSGRLSWEEGDGFIYLTGSVGGVSYPIEELPSLIKALTELQEIYGK